MNDAAGARVEPSAAADRWPNKHKHLPCLDQRRNAARSLLYVLGPSNSFILQINMFPRYSSYNIAHCWDSALFSKDSSLGANHRASSSHNNLNCSACRPRIVHSASPNTTTIGLPLEDVGSSVKAAVNVSVTCKRLSIQSTNAEAQSDEPDRL